MTASPASGHHDIDPSAPYDFRNASPSPFGEAAMPPYLDLPLGERQLLAVPITLRLDALQEPAFRYLVGFNLHTDAVRVDNVTLTRDGKEVAIEEDRRSDALQPRVIIAGADLPRSGTVQLLLSGTALARQDGQAHVGVLVIAFDAGWGVVRTEDGAAGQAYAFTLAMAEGRSDAGLLPNFHGQGNDALALAPLGALALCTALGLRSGWRHLHPPAPKPKKAPKAVEPAPQPPGPSTAARPPGLPDGAHTFDRIGRPVRPVAAVARPLGQVRRPAPVAARPAATMAPRAPFAPLPATASRASAPAAPPSAPRLPADAWQRPKAPLASASSTVVARPLRPAPRAPAERRPGSDRASADAESELLQPIGRR